MSVTTARGPVIYIPPLSVPKVVETTSPRRGGLALIFLLPVLIAGLSWAADGVPDLTDAAMVVLTIACVLVVLHELLAFPSRLGIGTLTLFSGCFVWFSYDYIAHWLGVESGNYGRFVFPPTTLAKGVFFCCLFMFSATLGLLLPGGRSVVRVIASVPDPNRDGFWVMIILFTFLLGLFPYLFLTTDPWYLAIYKSMFGGRASGVTFLVGRSGRLNTNWGGYITWFVDTAYVGGVLAGAYAILFGKNGMFRVFAMGIWVFWLMMAFGTGTRSVIIFVGFPVFALVFVKYSLLARTRFKKLSVKAYIYTGIIMFVFLFLIQIAGILRTIGYLKAHVSEYGNIAEIRGNEMFSSTLLIFHVIPDQFPRPDPPFPGYRIVMPIPNLIKRFVIHPIPRVIWPGKPIGSSEFGLWLNAALTGGAAITEGGGGTVCMAIHGGPYAGAGASGVIQFGLVFGWLLGVVERAFRGTLHRPFAMLFCLSLATYFFRCFRDFAPANFYQTVLPILALSLLIYAVNKLYATDPSAT